MAGELHVPTCQVGLHMSFALSLRHGPGVPCFFQCPVLANHDDFTRVNRYLRYDSKRVGVEFAPRWVVRSSAVEWFMDALDCADPCCTADERQIPRESAFR